MSSNHIVLNKRFFQGCPTFYSRKGLYKHILTSMSEILDYSISKHERTLATRLELILPTDFDDESLNTISEFFSSLKTKLETELKQTSKPEYVWRRRDDLSSSTRYQVILFTDGDICFGKNFSNANKDHFIESIRNAWKESLEANYKGDEQSSVIFENRGNDGLGTLCTKGVKNIRNSVFTRMSVLAEADKEGRVCFGTSLD